MNRTLVALAVAVFISGCAVVQPLPPKLDLPAGLATPAQETLLQNWWLAFDDPVLTKLIDEAFAQNYDLRTAMARIEAARSQVLLAQSELAPDINLNVAPSRTRISGVGSQRLPIGTPLTSNDFRVAIEMSYELDVWGKYRSGALASQNDLTAAQYYRETVRIGVAADVANAYFRLRAADAEMGVLESTLKLRTETAQLLRDRFEGGLIGEYDVRSAEAERFAVLADIARTKRAIGQLETAVATLTGRSPQAVFAPDVARGTAIDAATVVPPLPQGLPVEILGRRPDIRRSEALLAGSELRIQQARADYYPSFRLGAFFGSEAATTGALFTGPAGIWSLGLGILQPLLALKAIEAQVELAKSNNDRAAVEYLQTVQIAFGEVRDALVANASARDVLAAETRRRDEIAKALEVAELRYRAGRTSFLEVIDAQRTLLAAETLRIDAARDAKLSTVDFAKALGGGWNPAQLSAGR
ncbi:MAG: efflux transporter outer membrane subunit [Betaproteobacteria bacterium]